MTVRSPNHGRRSPVARAAACALAAGAVACAAVVHAQPSLRNIYVLTQAFCLAPQAATPGTCHDQQLPAGATLEIQLPGTPSVWTVKSADPILEAGETKKLANPGGIAGTGEIYIFRFKAAKPGSGTVVFQEAPPSLAKPGGAFTFPITVK